MPLCNGKYSEAACDLGDRAIDKATGSVDRTKANIMGNLGNTKEKIMATLGKTKMGVMGTMAKAQSIMQQQRQGLQNLILIQEDLP